MRPEEPHVATCLKVMTERLEVRLGEIKDDREQQRQWAARQESTGWRKADMENGQLLPSQ